MSPSRSDLLIDERQPDQASRRAPCASAFLTSDCEIPNCLAIADGLTPALKAARTAFSLPVVNEPAPSSEASWRRCGFASATGFSFAGAGGSLTGTLSFSGDSQKQRIDFHIIQPFQCSGQVLRVGAAAMPGCPGPVLPFGTAEGPAATTVGRAENRSSVVSVGRRLGMPQLCRRWLTPATAGRANHHVALAPDRLLAAEAEHLAVEHPTICSFARKYPTEQRPPCAAQVRTTCTRPEAAPSGC